MVKFNKTVILASAAAMMLCSGCAAKNAPETEAATSSDLTASNEAVSDVGTVEIPEEWDVGKFQGSEQSVYYLDMEGTHTDITDYVVSAEDGIVSFRSGILTDLFGLTKQDGTELITYADEKTKIQFEEDGSVLMVNGQTYASPEVKKIEGTEEYQIPLNFVYGMGYEKYSTSRQGDALTITLGDNFRTGNDDETAENGFFDNGTSEEAEDTVTEDAVAEEDAAVEETAEAGEEPELDEEEIAEQE